MASLHRQNCEQRLGQRGLGLCDGWHREALCLACTAALRAQGRASGVSDAVLGGIPGTVIGSILRLYFLLLFSRANCKRGRASRVSGSVFGGVFFFFSSLT